MWLRFEAPSQANNVTAKPIWNMWLGVQDASLAYPKPQVTYLRAYGAPLYQIFQLFVEHNELAGSFTLFYPCMQA